MRRALGPMFAPVTYRRWGHLLLGGALLSPYLMIVVLVPKVMLGPVFGTTVPVFTSIVSGLLGVITGLLPATRRLEIALARSLLGGRAGQLSQPAARWRPQWRAAVWFWLHLGLGGMVAALTAFIPLGLAASVVAPFYDGVIALYGWRSHTGWASSWIPVAGIAGAVTVVWLVAAIGAGLARLAPVLLGPSRGDRLAELTHHADRLAERNRLARELHDSVGHALTIATLQAGAAHHVFESNPAFARQALAAIEEAGRSAMAELDHVVGLLRADEGTPAPQRPRPTLADLERLLDTTRALGVPVDLTITGVTGNVPVTVSREAYRIVQEGLTNVIAHAGRVPVTLLVAIADDVLDLDMTNPLRTIRVQPGRGRRRGRRGLRGMRERVTLLGGAMSVTAVDGRWRVRVRLPWQPAP